MSRASWCSRFLSSAGCLVLVAVAPAPLHAQTIGLPLACRLGATCFIQNWIDLDPGPGRADPACGPLAYDGHDGLDFRVPMRAMRAGVAVIAPAAGVVRGVRDGEPDGVFRATGRLATAERECGNGVVIDHGAGLETQVCHLQRGSLLVRSGDRVRTGQPLGRVGLSGASEFPHVHLSVRRDGQKIDPSTDRPISQSACRMNQPSVAKGLWSRAPGYMATAVVDLGFAEAAPAQAARADDLPPASGSTVAPAIIVWAIVMGPRTGDETTLRLLTPEGAILAENRVPHARDQAQHALFAGKRRPGGAWPAGRYRAEVVVRRGGAEIARRTEPLQVR